MGRSAESSVRARVSGCCLISSSIRDIETQFTPSANAGFES
jgi:hypothetical protein